MTARRGPLRRLRTVLATHVAPPRFVLFAAIVLMAATTWQALRQGPWYEGLVIGFDLGALVFVLSLWPLSRDHSADEMRRHAIQNDANRTVVLVLTGLTTLAIMAAIGAELPAAHGGSALAIGKLLATLVLAWTFTQLVFALHYAHMRYCEGSGRKGGGFVFPGTPEPDYWDFLYFSFTAGMSFAASDVEVTRGDVRRVVVAQCLLSFVFNIGVLAFSINVLAGAAS